MDGVTILTETFVRGADLFQVCAGWIGFIIFAAYLFGEIFELWRLSPYIQYKLFVVGLGVFVVMLLVVILSFVYNNHVEYQTFYTEYTVTVDDSVEFNEFYNRYEIISQNGDIYTVREVDE